MNHQSHDFVLTEYLGKCDWECSRCHAKIDDVVSEWRCSKYNWIYGLRKWYRNKKSRLYEVISMYFHTLYRRNKV